MMYQKIIQKLKNKKIAILGFGREGVSTYNFIKKNNIECDLTIIDGNEKLLDNYDYLLKDNSVNLVLGSNYLDNLAIYDLIIKTPGISLKNCDITLFQDRITSQLELILEIFRDKCIGITGTKGKSTTTSLIYRIFKDQGYDAYLLGNIGIPLLDYAHQFTENSILVIEMSAHQLEFIKTSPKYGIILNLFEEHLDHFGSLNRYYGAKLNMFKYQQASDYALYLRDNDTLNNYIENNDYLSNLLALSVKEEVNTYRDNDYVYIKQGIKIKKVYDLHEERYLLGDHNLIDIMFALTISDLFNLNNDKTIQTIDGFKGLEHRLELVGTYDSVIYYNDAIATIPEATINAIKTLKEVDTLIFGGMDRGINYDSLIAFLAQSNVKNLIAMKDTGYSIGHKIETYGTNNKLYYVDDLKEAVLLAKKYTKKGKICLLSPAAPSYNAFKNFEEKGKQYKKLVKENEEDL